MLIAEGHGELLSFAHTLAQIVRLANTLDSPDGLSHYGIASPQPCIGHGETRVEADRPLKKRDCGSRIDPDEQRPIAEAIGLQRLQRWRGHAFRWRVILLHRGQ